MSLKQRALGLTRLSLHQVEKNETSMVFVINNTSPRGNVNVTVADGMGSNVDVRVPVTSIPVDLSYQASKQNLISNPAVRTMAAKNVLIFVDPESAVRFLETDPDAIEENRRLYAQGNVAEVGSADNHIEELSSVQAENDGDINPFALVMANESTSEEDDIIRDLKARIDELSEEDLTYIARVSRFEKVKSWAAAQVVADK